MTEALGWTGLIGAALATLVLGLRRRRIALILAVAFGARASAALFHFYVTPLPDGTADAVAFERRAWEWAQDGLWPALSAFPGMDAYFYSWLASLVYAVTDRSLLLLQSINVLGGVLGVLVTWRVARELWDEHSARKAAWIMALFPMVVQYGALPMREVWFVLFFMLGALGAVRWARGGGAAAMVLAVGGFMAAAFFHGAAFVTLLAFFGVVGWRACRHWLRGIARGRLRVVASVAILAVLGLAAAYVGTGVSVHKLGTAEEMVSTERWMHHFESRVYGDARYPQWTQPSSSADLVWAVPLRAVYLLFSPFPWDVREPAHLIGLLDGLLYLTLTVLIWRGRRVIWQEPGARTLLLLTVPLVLAFGVGTGNFGTGLRHRAKFVAVLIVLASVRLVPLVIRRGARYERQTFAHGDLTAVKH